MPEVRSEGADLRLTNNGPKQPQGRPPTQSP